jgi:tripartite ATP-independent transporter DctM subunit
MTPALVGAGALVSILGLAFFGVPIGVAIMLVSSIAITITSGWAMTLVSFQTLPFATAADYDFIVVPIFVLMGNIAASSGMLEQMFNAADKWFSGMRGGLYTAVTLASAAFGAPSGSSVVNAAVFTRMALPQMIRFGYDRGASCACIAAAGTFAVMIPPSLAFVLYGIMTGESVGKLFIAGVLPGLLTAVLYMILIPVLVRLLPHWAPPPAERATWREKASSLRHIWAMSLLIGLSLGGIYAGWFPASAAGAIGAAGAIAIGIALRKLTWRAFVGDVRQAVTMTGSIFLTIIAGFMFARFLVNSGAVGEMTQFIQATGMGKAEFLVFVVILYLVLGILLDGASLAVLTLPILYPVAISLGLDGIWFGVIFVKLVEIDSITPPFGLNLFTVVASSSGQVDMRQVTRAIWPFVAIEYCVLLLLILVPELSLWLPNTMK